MKTDKKLFLGFALAFLAFFSIGATLQVSDLELTGPMDAGGFSISNIGTSTNASSAATVGGVASAKTKLVEVADATARKALTSGQVKVGDMVKEVGTPAVLETVIVSDAEYSEFNGTYTEDGMSGGEKKYSKGSKSIHHGGGGNWYISDSGTNVYQSTSGLTGPWTPLYGGTPPTVTEGLPSLPEVAGTNKIYTVLDVANLANDSGWLELTGSGGGPGGGPYAVFYIPLPPGSQWTDFELKASSDNFTNDAANMKFFYHSPNPTYLAMGQRWTNRPQVYFTDSGKTGTPNQRMWIAQSTTTSIFAQLTDANSEVGGFIVVVKDDLLQYKDNLVWSYLLLDSTSSDEDPANRGVWRPIWPSEWVSNFNPNP